MIFSWKTLIKISEGSYLVSDEFRHWFTLENTSNVPIYGTT